MEADYSPREIEAKFANAAQLSTMLHDQQMEVLERIEAQTVRTNGRVTKLEGQQQDIAIWRGQVKVIIYIIGFIIASIIIPLLGAFISSHPF